MTTSTSTVVLDPAAVQAEHDPLQASRRAITVGIAMLAPILFTVSNVLLPKLTGTTANVVRHIPPVADRLLATHLLYALASMMLVCFAIALWRIDVRRGAALRFIGGVLLIIGAVSNALGEVVDGYVAWGLHRTAVDDGAQTRLLDLLDKSNAALPISFIAIPILSLGLVLLMVGVLRSRLVSWWLPVLTIVGGIAAGFVGVGIPALVGLVWSVSAAAVVLLVARASSATA